MPYEKIHAYPKGCILFRKDHEKAKYCVECGSSRFLEVDSSDGQKRQLDITVKILRYLPFLLRIQWLYMTEETAKQMIWHKNGRRYNPDKLVHPFDGDDDNDEDDGDDYIDMADSDDETYDPANADNDDYF
jgi:hypothetical protein